MFSALYFAVYYAVATATSKSKKSMFSSLKPKFNWLSSLPLLKLKAVLQAKLKSTRISA